MAAARNLTDPDQNRAVLDAATGLTAAPGRLAELTERCSDAAGVGALDPVLVEAGAAARSKHALGELAQAAAVSPVHVSVVFAMYGETERILPVSQHPHGEDFVGEKVRQLDWLAADVPGLTWELIAVDDGCPNDPSSADEAERVAAEQGLDRVTVLRLADAITERIAVTDHFGALKTTDDSRKGGAIAYGMWAGANGHTHPLRPNARHVIVYTDADLSTNLAQIGSLIAPVLNTGAAAATGQRYGLPGAVLVKESGPQAEPDSTGAKPDKMIILFRHFVRATLIPPLAPVLDTQAGFKAFDARVVRQALPGLAGFNETFDVEMLLLAGAATGRDIAAVPIVFTEDFAATNFPSVDPGARHLAMLTQIVEIHDRMVPAESRSPDAAGLRDLIADLDLDGYIAIIEALRQQDRDDAEAGRPDPLFDRTWGLDRLQAMIRP